MEAAHSALEPPAPPDWIKLITERVDFAAAFAALEGYQHFHSETLRGMVRKNQLRTEKAWGHFARAESLYASAPPSPENREYFFYLKLYECDTAILDEASSPGALTQRRTDETNVAFSELDTLGSPLFQQIQITQLAFYNLIRGDHHLALTAFEKLCEESRARVEEQQTGFYFGAAASAHELGLRELAEKYYESAALGVSFLSSPFKICLYSGRLHTLMRHWRRPEEAESWLDRLRRVQCPEESKGHFIERARIFTQASTARRRIIVS